MRYKREVSGLVSWSTIIVSLLLAGACGAARSGTPPQPESLTRSAIQIVRTSLLASQGLNAHLDLIVAQSISSRLGGAGGGVAAYQGLMSDVTLKIKGGGTTEVRELGGDLFIRSFNSATEQQRGTWIRIPSDQLPKLLAWPPQALADPAYLFASASLMRVLRTRLVAAQSLPDQDLTNRGLLAFRLILNGFPTQATQASKPDLTCWIDSANHVRRITLVWPLTSAGASSSGGSTRPIGGGASTILITLALGEFGVAVHVAQPDGVLVMSTPHT